MIQPGGAMALFVLRLAGLLSLEKSLEENSTSIFLSNVTTNQSLYDFTNNSYILPNESSVPSGHYNITNNSKIKTTPKYSFFKSEIKNNTLNKNNYDDFMKEKYLENTKLLKNNSRKNDLSNFKVYNGSNSNTSEERLDYGTNALAKTEIPTTFKSGDEALSTSTTSLSLPQRSSETGFSPVVTQEVNNTATPQFLGPSKSSKPKFPLAYISPINESNFQELEAPHSNFVSKDFEYYDLKDLNYNSPDYVHNLKYNSSSDYDLELKYNSSDYVPDSTSRSLVPQPGYAKSQTEYLEKATNNEESNDTATPITVTNVYTDPEGIGENGNVTDLNYVTPNITSVPHSKSASNETLKKRGIGPVLPPDKPAAQIQVRNNPYPYGPKVLPTHTLTYKPNLTFHQVPNTYETLYPDKDIYYDYGDGEEEGRRREEDTKEDNGGKHERRKESVFFVKTEKPIVLFHFDKPGYSPKLPDSSLPPTRAPTPSDPWDCAPRCPSYSLVDWNQDYDIRQYPVTTWISTIIIAENRILAELEGYMKVQDYFYGLNDRGQLLNMTVPFVTQIKHGRHPGVLNELTDFTVSLYANHIDDPLNYDLPTPISNEVLIDRLETKTAFVAGFEANVWEVTEKFLHEKASQLMERLRQNGEAFLDRYFYLASYSRPELYQPVYYELWIYATSFRSNPIVTSPLAPRARPPPNKITAKTISKLCRGVECPPFEVLRTYRYGIQKRRYFDGLFAITNPGVCEFSTVSVWKGFMPLHLYKHGINSHMEVIEATRPIGLVHIKEDSTSTTECPQNLTMAIYLPKRLHSNPPLTGYDAPSVKISALQDVVVYAYTVGGYLLEPDRVRKEVADVKHRLTEFGACFKDDEYYVVVYDFIIRYHGRQNEIWVVAENCKATLNG